MQKQLVMMVDELKQVEGDMVSQKMDPSSASEYRVQYSGIAPRFRVFSFFVLREGPRAHTL